MAEPAVVEETLVLVDADGNVTEDRDKAVGGEVLQTLADGATLSTRFKLTGATGR